MLSSFSCFSLFFSSKIVSQRKRREREKDERLRSLAQAVLPELEDMLSRGLDLVGEQRKHSGIKPQADRGECYLLSSMAFSRDMRGPMVGII